MAAAFSIRNARLPDDEPVMVRFIDALQAFEHDFEPDRRIDPRAGADYLPDLLRRVCEDDGEIFIAEQDGRPVGWAVFHCRNGMSYIIESERRCGYIAELYIDESARGLGIGLALMEACEAASSARGLTRLMIGVHAGNARARQVYEAAGFTPYALELRKYL